MRVARYALAALMLLSTPVLSQNDALQERLARLAELLEKGDAAGARELAQVLVADYPQSGRAWFGYARALHASDDLDGAIEAGRTAARFPEVRASSLYNLACAYALSGDADRAFDALRRAKRAGFADRKLMQSDPDLESIRFDPRFVLPRERKYATVTLQDGSALEYSIDLPVGFDPEKTYPVLVGPGEGSKSADSGGRLFWGEDSAQRGWIVVESLAFLLPEPARATRALLDEIEARYNVEGGKFHFAGFDANAAGAFIAAASMPERLHSITVLPGFPRAHDNTMLQALQGVRVEMIVGEKDIGWLEPCREALKALKKAGVEAYLTVIPDGGHVPEKLFGGEFMERMQAVRKAQS